MSFNLKSQISSQFFLKRQFKSVPEEETRRMDERSDHDAQGQVYYVGCKQQSVNSSAKIVHISLNPFIIGFILYPAK
jgi:hypothetical protein